MSIPRPKILTVITVPTGGWAFKFYLSNLAQYDTPITVTVAAGDYFVSWDMQSDDLLRELGDRIQTGIITTYGGWPGNYFCNLSIDTDGKIVFKFWSAWTGARNDIKLAWTESAADLARALGYDNATDDASTVDNNPAFTGDWQHGHGWYAEEDGLLETIGAEDVAEVEVVQSRALSGRVYSQRLAQRFRNEAKLRWLPAAKTWSNGVGYGEANVHPYPRNEALECWWRAVNNGARFRFYREGRLEVITSTPRAVSDIGVSTATAAATLTNTNKTLIIDPQQHKGMLLIGANTTLTTTYPRRFFISSHTATVYTVPAHYDGAACASAATTYYILDQRYRTYVADLEKMKALDPREVGDLDRFDIELSLLKYIA